MFLIALKLGIEATIILSLFKKDLQFKFKKKI